MLLFAGMNGMRYIRRFEPIKNTMKSKHFIIGMILAVSGIAVMAACSREEKLPGTKRAESAYERMGRLHNEGLDYVLARIVATAPATKSGGRVIPPQEEIRAMCRDFALRQGEPAAPASKAGDPSADDVWNSLSAGQQAWLEQAKACIFTAPQGEVEALIAGLSRLEEQVQADASLPAAEQETVLYVLAVCRYSAAYWAENYEKWRVELYGLESLSPARTRASDEMRYVSKEWWEEYKHLVWADGVGGVPAEDGGYYIEVSTAASVNSGIY